MAIEKNTMNVVSKFKLGSEQVSAECNITTEEQISKLLSYCVYPMVINEEVLVGEVNVSGKIAVKLTYMTQENQIVCRDSICDFSNKYSNAGIDPSLKINVCSKLVDASAVVLSENNVKINSIVELTFTAVKQEELSYLSSADQTFCTKGTEIKVTTLTAIENQDFEEDIKVQIKDKFERLISVDADVIVKDVTAGSNFVSVSGEIITKAMFLSDSETGKIITQTSSENFKRELEVAGVSQTSMVEVNLTPRKDLLKVETNSENNNVTLNLTVTNRANITAFDENMVNATEDIYSLTNNIEIVTESFKKLSLGGQDYFESKIEGSLTLSEAQPRVDKILTTSSPYIISTNSYIKDGEIILEGVAYTNVIYLNDEEMTTNSIQIEVPFTISEKTSSAENAELNVTEVLDDVDVIVKKGRELYFDAKVKANVNYYSNENDAIITDVAVGEDLPERDCAIEIYFGKEGDTLWDIAKLLNISLDSLKEQNSMVPEVLEGNTNLSIYYQKNKKVE